MSVFLREMFGISVQQLVAAGIVGVASAAVVYSAFRSYRKTSKPLVFHPVGKLSGIGIYPIKSCRGQALSSAEVRPPGIWSNGVYDRHFVVLNEVGNFVTLRQEPTLALLRPTILDDGRIMTLEAPGMDPISINLADLQATGHEDHVVSFRLWGKNSEGLYCGKEVGAWISTYLKKPDHTLVCFKKGVTKPQKPKNCSSWGSRFNSKDEVCGYPDFSQFMLLTEASLADLNTRLKEPRPMKQFRPNLVVSGTHAYDEDTWKFVRIGESVTFRRTHPCGRCRLTLVDPETGVVDADSEPLKTLKGYRVVDKSSPDSKPLHQSPVFGANLHAEVFGTINVGDTVYAAM